MEMYKNPVTLVCGHNFCLDCIEKTWNSQDGDDTSCPICRRRSTKRPELNKNLVLSQIAELCHLTSVKKSHERCTCCTSYLRWPAVKQCLLCEAHLKDHSKQAEHVILDPSASRKNRRCSIHKAILEYYCSQDSACVCAHCCIVGEHKGHQVTPVREDKEIKKDKLRDTEDNRKPQKSETEKSGEEARGDSPCEEEDDEEEHTYPWVTPIVIEFIIICCICMEMYTNPVTLVCGHNCCLDCIEKIWNNQDSDDTSCPICRRRFKKRPELNKNLVLCQIAELCQSSKLFPKSHERCTYCASFTQEPAVKQCLLCEAFLCEDHLKVHSKKAEHVILELSASPKDRKCSIHKTVLEYYCSQDSACVCAHCCIVGEHKGHQVTPFRKAMEIKKDKLRDIEENLNLKKSEIEKYIKIWSQKVQEKALNASEARTDVIEVREMRQTLELVQGGLSIEEGQPSVSVEDLIRQLEAKRSQLTQCIARIEKLCYETDPFLVLQDQEDYNL